MRQELRGGVALVTGASSGVGWLTALKLADAGMRLCVTARRREPLEELRRQIEDRGGECLVVTGDVTSAGDVQRTVDACVERYGRLDLLVNNAAVQAYARFLDYDWDEIERIVAVNLYGYLRFTRAAVPHFRAQGRGTIVNVLSVLSKGALQLFSMYAATKHALLGWANSIRLELAPENIDVCSVLLPAMATPLYDHARSKLGVAMKPLPPIYDPEVGARAVLQCARRPRRRRVPVFLQGNLILWSDFFFPVVGDFILRRWGERWQRRAERVDPAGGNLFAPTPRGAGPRGSLKPTPRWKRYAPAGVLAAAVAGVSLQVMRRRAR